MPSFIHLTVSEKKNFEYFFENLPFMLPSQPIKSSDLDKSHMKHGGLLNKHFCKKNLISPITWQKLSISAFPIIIIMKSLDPLRAKKTSIRKKLGHTAVSAIKASSVTLLIWQKEPEYNAVNLQIFTWQSSKD